MVRSESVVCLICLQRCLQAILNAAACLVFRLQHYDHMADVLAILHWLCLLERVNLKLVLMAYCVQHGMAWHI